MTTKNKDDELEITLTFVDDDNEGSVITEKVRRGLRGSSQTIIFGEDKQLKNYVAGKKQIFKWEFGKETTKTIHLTHRHRVSMYMTTATVVYLGLPDNLAIEPNIQTIIWNKDRDEVTKESRFTPHIGSSFSEVVKTPIVVGFRPDKLSVAPIDMTLDYQTGNSETPIDKIDFVTYVEDSRVYDINAILTFYRDNTYFIHRGGEHVDNAELGIFSHVFETIIVGSRNESDPTHIEWLVDREQILSSNHKTDLPIISGYSLRETSDIPFSTHVDLGTVYDFFSDKLKVVPLDEDYLDISNEAVEERDETTVGPFDYDPKSQKMTIDFVSEEDSNKILHTQVIDDVTNEYAVSDGQIRDIAEYNTIFPTIFGETLKGYEFVSSSLQTPEAILTFAADDELEQVATIKVRVKHQVEALETIVTIHYDGLPEALKLEDNVQTISWECDKDEVTEVVTYKPLTEMLEVSSPVIEDYAVDQENVDVAVVETTVQPENITLTVTYNLVVETLTAQLTYQRANLYFLDNELEDELQQTFEITIQGKREVENTSEISWVLDRKQVVVANDENVALPEFSGYNLTTAGETVLSHTLDLGTIFDYFADELTKIAATISADELISCGTTDIAEKKEYYFEAQPQKIIINYVDVTDDDKIILRDEIDGKFNQTIAYEFVDIAGYDYISGKEELPKSFNHLEDVAQTITIQLKHKYVQDTFATTLLVNYIGLPDLLKPAPAIRTINWKANLDEATGITTYQPVTVPKTIVSPSIVGYTVDVETVVAAEADEVTTRPEDLVVTVTYRPMTFTVTFHDESIGQVLKTLAVTADAFEKELERYQAKGYIIKENNVPSERLPDAEYSVFLSHSTKRAVEMRLANFTANLLAKDNLIAPQELILTAEISRDYSFDLVTGDEVPSADLAKYDGASAEIYSSNQSQIIIDSATGVISFDIPVEGEMLGITVDGDVADFDHLQANLTVNYVPPFRKITLCYVDDETTEEIGTVVREGAVGSVIQLDFESDEKLKKYRYHGEGDYFDRAFDDNDTADETVTVHLAHRHSQGAFATSVAMFYRGLPETRQLEPTVQTISWTTDTDEVTGVMTYIPSAPVTTLASPEISGYTVENVESLTLELRETTAQPESIEMTITYAANDQEVTITVVDDDANGEVVDSYHIIGKTDASFEFQKNWSADYLDVTDYSGISTRYEADDDRTITLHLKHQHTQGTHETQVTVVYANLPEELQLAAVSQTIAWATDTDQVLGLTTYTPLTPVTSVPSPEVLGYRAEKSEILPAELLETTVQPEDVTATVAYIATEKKILVNIIDKDKDDEIIDSLFITGKIGEPFEYQGTCPADYLDVTDYSSLAIFYEEADKEQIVEIHLRHKHTQGTHETTLTLSYTGLPLELTPAAMIQTISWESDTDEVTHITTYKPISNVSDAPSSAKVGHVNYTFLSKKIEKRIEGIPSPPVAGYTAEKSEVLLDDLQETTTKPEDIVMTVAYTANTKEVTVTVVDDDKNGKIIDSYVVTGKTGESFAYQQKWSTAYQDVTDYSNISNYYIADDNAQTVTIHLIHHHTKDTFESKAIVSYLGVPEDRQPTSNIQAISWEVDTDDVTGDVRYRPLTTLVAVPSPIVLGYTADTAELAVLDLDETSIKPDDIETGVTYTANEQKVIVNVVDDDNDNDIVDRYEVIGRTDEVFEFQTNWPPEYLDVTDYSTLPKVHQAPRDEEITQFVTIHLTHTHTVGTYETQAVVKYAGLPKAKLPAPTIQTIVWNIDRDEVTGVTLYKPTMSANRVPNPTIAGYTAEIAGVAAIELTETETKPENLTTTVAYLANEQRVMVTVVDDDKHAEVVDSYTLTGKTGETFAYQKNWQAGYLDVTDYNNFATTYDDNDGIDQTITIHLAHNHVKGRLETLSVIEYAGLPDDKKIEPKTQTISWEVDKDEITGVMSYKPLTSADLIVSQVVAGYTADKKEVSAALFETTTEPTDLTTTVTYTPDMQGIKITVIDDDLNETIVTYVVTGKTDEPIVIHPNWSEDNYLDATDYSQVPNKFEPDEENKQVIAIHLWHKHKPGTYETSVTVTYTGLPEDKQLESSVQTVSWATDTDLASDVTTYTPLTSINLVTSPLVLGYTAESADVFPAILAETMTKPEDIEKLVAYTADVQKVTVRVIDDDKNGELVDSYVVEGKTDETFEYQENWADGYQDVTDYSAISNRYEADSENEQTVTIHLTHKHSLGTHETRSTVTYFGLPQAKELAPTTQTISWKTDTDEVTKLTTYAPVTAINAVPTPVISGYIAEKAEILPVDLSEMTTQPEDSSETVTYVANEQKVQVTVVDDDNDGEILETYVLTGKTGRSFTYQKNWATTYEDVTDYQLLPTHYDDNDAADQLVRLHLTHKHTQAKLETNASVIYLGLPEARQLEKNNQTLTWITDKDEVTGITTYYPKSVVNAVSSPSVSGYSPEKTEVSAINLKETTTRPEDRTATVVYTANEQKVMVTIIDDEQNQTIDSYLMTGKTDEPFDYHKKCLPGYVDATDYNSFSNFYDDKDGVNQVVTIHLTHKHTAATFETLLTVNYVGLPEDKEVAVHSQTLVWQTDTDEVTRVIAYKPVMTDVIVQSPVIAGYTASQLAFTLALTETTTEPENVTATVTYEANHQEVKVSVVDDEANGELIDSYVLIGKTDEVFKLHKNWSTSYVDVTNYDNIPNCYQADENEQIITLHLVHDHTQGSLETKATVVYAGLPDDKQLMSNIQTISWATDKDKVTSMTTYTPVTPVKTVPSPVVVGYTPEKSEIFLAELAERTVKPEELLVTVTYTADVQDVTVTVVDDDNKGEIVDSYIVEGRTDDSFEYQVNWSDKYVDVTDYTLLSNRFAASGGQMVTIHLAHKHTQGTYESMARIVYTGLPEDKKRQPTVQPISWTTDTDEVSAFTTYKPVDSLPIVPSPIVSGYTAEYEEVMIEVAETTDQPETIEMLVAYTANEQQVTVNVLDIDNDGELVDSYVLIGQTDEPIDYHKNWSESYEDVTDYQQVSNRYDDTVEQIVTLHLAHKHTRDTLKTSATVSYTGLPKARMLEPIVQTISWESDEDEVTGVTLYTPSSSINSVSSPVIPGYTPEKTKIDTIKLVKTTTKPEDLLSTVAYTADMQKVTVTIVDDDERGEVIGRYVTIGKTDEPLEYQKKWLPSYEDVTNYDSFVNYYEATTTRGQAITIHLAHRHTFGTLETVAQVAYVGLPDDKQLDSNVQTISWETDKDEVTGIINYKPITVVNPVPSPPIDFFKADKPRIVAPRFGQSTTKPEDVFATVTYTALSFYFTFIDETIGRTLAKSKLTAAEFKVELAQYLTDGYLPLLDGKPVDSLNLKDINLNEIRGLVRFVHNSKRVVETKTADFSVTLMATGFEIDKQIDLTAEISHDYSLDLVTNRAVTTANIAKVANASAETYHSDNRQVVIDVATGEISFDLPINGEVTETIVASGEANFTNLFGNVTIVYEPTLQKITLAYVDDDDNGRVIGTTKRAGLSGSEHTFVLADEADALLSHYVYNGEGEQFTWIFDGETTAEQTEQIHLAHRHTSGTFETNVAVIYVGLPDEKKIEPVIQKVSWSTDTDDVTGLTIYTPLTTINTVVHPIVSGYMTAKAEIAPVKLTERTTEPKDMSAQVTYTATEQQVLVTVVDDDTDGQVLDSYTLVGKTDDVINYRKNWASIYVEVTDESNLPSYFEATDGAAQAVTIHLAHRHDYGTFETSNRVIYTGLPEANQPEPVVQTIAWKTDKDDVTGELMYQLVTEITPVASPVISGYTADKATVLVTMPLESLTTPESVETFVSYTATEQTLTVTIVDDENNEEILDSYTLTGKTDELIDYRKEWSDSYCDVTDYSSLPTHFQETAANNAQNVTIHLTHKHHKESYESKVMVVYVGLPKDRKLEPNNQSIAWEIDYDDVTDVTTYTPLTQPISVPNPLVLGYGTKFAELSAPTLTARTTEPGDLTAKVTYTANKQKVVVILVDDEKDGEVVETYTLTGKTDEQIVYPKDCPAMYLDVTDYRHLPSHFDANDSADQKATIHLIHQHMRDTYETKFTISYDGLSEDKKLPLNVQTISWKTNLDEVTGITTYQPMQQPISVPNPSVVGYTTRFAEVTAPELLDTITQPEDLVLTVAYTANAQQVTVTVVDDDNDGEILDSYPVTGKTDETIIHKPYPAQYVDVTDYSRQATRYEADETVDQVLTIHLKHKHTQVDYETKLMVVYVGLPKAQHLAPTVQVIYWKIDTDLVTGVISYQPVTVLQPIASPLVVGYATESSEVVVDALLEQPTKPENIVLTVNYHPISFTLICDFPNRMLTMTVLTAREYEVVLASYRTRGYVIKSTDVPSNPAECQADTIYSVRFVHGTKRAFETKEVQFTVDLLKQGAESSQEMLLSARLSREYSLDLLTGKQLAADAEMAYFDGASATTYSSDNAQVVIDSMTGAISFEIAVDGYNVETTVDNAFVSFDDPQANVSVRYS
ncbi:mucin-binding protein [Lactococcus hodotermopsidis]|nr:hypothetical protein [Lactococcus hodotermopsidis]